MATPGNVSGSRLLPSDRAAILSRGPKTAPLPAAGARTMGSATRSDFAL